MDENLKTKLREAMESSKDAVEDMKLIIKNITKEIALQSKENGEDLQKTAQELFEEIAVNLKSLGKNSVDFLKAAFNGVMEGIKESVEGENNLAASLFGSLNRALQHLGEAGIYVAKESLKSLQTLIEQQKTKHNTPPNNEK